MVSTEYPHNSHQGQYMQPELLKTQKTTRCFGKLHLIKLFVLQQLKHIQKRLRSQETYEAPSS